MEHTNGKPSSALSDAVDYSRVLHNGVSRNVLETVLGEHDEAIHQETTVLQGQVNELSAALEHSRSALERAESQDTWLEAPIDLRDEAREGPALTAEAIGEMISSRFAELQSHWNQAQTEQYRQLVSQVAEIQSDLDNVSISMQALQPMDLDEPGLDSSLLEQILTHLEAMQARAVDGEHSDSVDEFNRLRYEVQGLRSDLQAVLQSLDSQQQRLQADIGQIREEMRSVLSVLTSESMDTFEKRQSQLRMDQLEMERNLAQLRQELVTTRADPGNKKKLWR